MGRRVYPAKMVMGAKVIRSAIRHPMVTSRKVQNFVHRKAIIQHTRNEKPCEWAVNQSIDEDLPVLEHSGTTAEGLSESDSFSLR